jgi:hypothetical protein
MGYTGIRVRGSDATVECNYQRNSIQWFWKSRNLLGQPDFASSLESLQLQRG